MKILAAYNLAAQLHRGQVDKAGHPYIEHLTRVFLRVVDAGGSRDQQIAALLHDSIEDGRTNIPALDAAGVPTLAVSIITALTRGSSEPYADYIQRVRGHHDAALVKLADLADNSDPERLALLPIATQVRLIDKYSRATDLLNQTAT